MPAPTCCNAYGISGEIDVNADEGIAYCIGPAVAQHYDARAVVIGFDLRATSPVFAIAAARGIRTRGLMC